MAIDKVQIKNFTVFEDIEIGFSKGMNVLIGENGTGKTHLLKLLYGTVQHAARMPPVYFSSYFGTDVKCGSVKYEFSNGVHEVQLGRYFDKDNQQNSDNQAVAICSFNNPPVIIKATGGYDMVYIPVKDILTHSKGFLSLYDKFKIPFDMTYRDIVSSALLPQARELPELAKSIIPALEKIIGGTIIVENETFYTLRPNGEMIDFSVEAEGIKKFGLLWQLLMNESITKDTVLLWDEPEANINPKLIPDIVEILLELSRQGVQVFVATHDYVFAKYFEVRRKAVDSVLFHSLYKSDNGVQCETNINFRDLQNNPIISSFDRLLDEVYFANVED